MKKLLPLFRAFLLPFLLVLGAQTKAQHLPKDSIYFVHLLDGSTIYSRIVDIRESISGGIFIQLDSSKTLPLGQVRDLKGWDGSFIVSMLAGMPYPYKLENEGRRISLYSICYPITEVTHPFNIYYGPHLADTAMITHKDLFFQKDDQGPVLPLTFKNLREALRDNPQSLHELELARSNIHLSIGLAAGGLALLGVGIGMTIHHNHVEDEKFARASGLLNPNPTPPGTPIFPPVGFGLQQNLPPPPPLPDHTISPLIYVGAATLFTATIPLFGVKKQSQRALDIYNDNY
jgi:hypothetical protein